MPDATPSEFGMEQKGTCNVPKVPTCSKRDERCVSNADCCAPTDSSMPQNTCIAGYCAFVVPQ
ncbi:MAG TPA: hypothetical protein VF331_04460 [Polyangiales bacterium]